MASSAIKIMCLFLVLGVALPGTYAAHYVVGDNYGWALGLNVEAWISPKTIKVADTFDFHFTSPRTVALVEEAGYLDCNPSNAAINDVSGSFSYTFTKSGTYYFISAGALDCVAGLKMKVIVN